MRTSLSILAIAVSLCLSAQDLVNSFSDMQVLGVKELDKSLLILSTEGKSVYITTIDQSGNTIWENYFKTRKPKSHNFNRIKILEDRAKVYIIENVHKETVIHSYAKSNGKEMTSITLKPGVSSTLWSVIDEKLIHFVSNEGSILKASVNNDKLSSYEQLTQIELKNYHPKLQVAFTTRDHIISTSRVLERNHRIMHLYLNKYDFSLRDTIQKSIDLELRASSFTYNSSLDKNVYGVISSEDGFYLVGKLDIPFKKKYPKDKIGEAFVGIWIAKFTSDLQLVYFKEMPFGMFQGLILNDIIRKPAILELSEFKDGSSLLVINELFGVKYGRKYMIYLSQTGEIGMAKSAIDEFHFFEYNRQGVRPAGRKINARLMNCDWPTYVTNSYLYLTPTSGFYSEELNSLLSLQQEKNRNKVRNKKIYCSFQVGKEILYLEYLDKKGGLLNVYVNK